MIDSFGPGGAQAFLANVLPEVGRQRFSLRVVALHGWGEAGERLQAAGVSCRSLARTRADPRIPLRLAEEARRFRPTVVHAHLVISSLLCETLFGGGSAAVVSHLQSQYRSPWRTARYQNALEPLVYRRCNVVVACSPTVAAGLQRRRGEGGPAARPVVVPNAIPSDWLERPPEGAVRAVREELGVREGEGLVLSASRLIALKNLTHALEVLAEARRCGARFVYAIAGEGPERSSLEARARTLGLGDSVRFIGARRDMKRLHDAADLFLLPSRVEGLPLALLEAMACGSVPVVTPFAGARTIVRDDRNGALIPFGGSNDRIAEAGRRLAGLLEDRDQRARLGAAARQTVAQRFTATRAARKLERLYTMLAEGAFQ